MKLSLLASTIITGFIVRAFMSDLLETVVIAGDDGPVRINKSEFDEKKHKVHKANKTHDENGVARKVNNADETKLGATKGGGDAPKSDALTVEQIAENARINAMKFGVMEDGGKYYVVDANNENNRVENVDGIENKKGYKTNADAWKAVFAVQAAVNKGTAT